MHICTQQHLQQEQPKSVGLITRSQSRKHVSEHMSSLAYEDIQIDIQKFSEQNLTQENKNINCDHFAISAAHFQRKNILQ